MVKNNIGLVYSPILFHNVDYDKLNRTACHKAVGAYVFIIFTIIVYYYNSILLQKIGVGKIPTPSVFLFSLQILLSQSFLFSLQILF